MPRKTATTCAIRVFTTRIAIVTLSASVVGCGNDVKPPLETYPVSGAVTLNGQPLAGADVTFRGGTPPRSAFGKTDAEGRYRLTTFKSGDGAVPGVHKVGVVLADVDPNPPPEARADTEDQFGGTIVEAPITKNVLPSQYADPETSGLTAEVTADGDNVFDFSLQP